MANRQGIIIDDDPLIRTLVKEILLAEGFDIEMAEDGVQGVELVERRVREGTAPDLIVLDVVMPGMNGLDVLTRLKLQSETSDLPVLMLTGEDKPEDILAGYGVGADYYITKPFTRQQLLYGVGMLLLVDGVE